MVKKSFGERVREAREKKGLSQAELSRKLCITRSVVTKYESNKARPSFSKLEKLNKVLELGLGL